MNILVSACLLGEKYRYDGGSCFCKEVAELKKDHNLIPVCPEREGGLPCPRTPSEICSGRVMSKDGQDWTEAFERGAKLCLEKGLQQSADLAILQPRSPSCGTDWIYDGSFSGTMTEGDGVFARLLKKNGLQILTPQTLYCCDHLENDLKLEYKIQEEN